MQRVPSASYGPKHLGLLRVQGDHGYELGEHNMWCKKNNFELGVRVPSAVGESSVISLTSPLHPY